MDLLSMINTAQQTGGWTTQERAEKLLLLLPDACSERLHRQNRKSSPHEEPETRRRTRCSASRRSFKEMVRVAGSGGQTQPAGKASKIIGALANGNWTKAVAQLTSFGVAPMTEATVNTITGVLRPNDDRLPPGLDQEGPSRNER